MESIKKIDSSCVIQKKSKAVKKFLRARNQSTVYMGELQRIQDFLSYTWGSNQSSEIRVFTDNQAALQALQNFNKCSKSYIMQTITQNIDDQRIRGTPIQRYWIPAHTNIKRNEEVDIAAKEATGWRHMKKKNAKWKN